MRDKSKENLAVRSILLTKQSFFNNKLQVTSHRLTKLPDKLHVYLTSGAPNKIAMK